MEIEPLKTLLFSLQLTVAGGFMILGFGSTSFLGIFGIILIFIGILLGGWTTRPNK
jgi:hypothetical protein